MFEILFERLFTGIFGGKGAAQGEIYFRFLLNKQESDCIYYFSNDFKPNGIPFGSKTIEKW